MTILDSLEATFARYERSRSKGDDWVFDPAAGQLLDSLLRNHAADLLAVARAAQAMPMNDPSAGPYSYARQDDLQTLANALAALTADGKE